MKIIGPTWISTFRRLKYVVSGWLFEREADVIRSFENAPTPFAPAEIIIYKQPPGHTWRPMWDNQLNANLEARGIGWRNFEAIEIWRDTTPKSGAVFSCQLMDCPALNVAGLWWRPLLTAAKIERKFN